MESQGQQPGLAPALSSEGRPMGRGLVPGLATLPSWLILATSLGLALAISYGFLGSSWMQYVAEWTADWTSRALNLVGTSTRVNGTILASDSFA